MKHVPGEGKNPLTPLLMTVSPQEAGMKLLRFLERRLAEPPGRPVLHKWIRTGQVRVNGGRAKAFSLLTEGDAVRVPPFAHIRPLSLAEHAPGTESGPGSTAPSASLLETAASLPPLPDIVVHAATPAFLVLNKPAGLPCQPGSGHQDSLSARLARAYGGRPFIPAPAHRLDRDTSGLVLAGRSHAAQKRLHRLFSDGGIRKEYLAWIEGDWPYTEPRLLRDTLVKQSGADGKERIAALPDGRSGTSLCMVAAADHFPFTPTAGEETRATLLLVLLLTGHKHQIRVQLASRGVPIIGDRRYHGAAYPYLLLHAYAVGLPGGPTLAAGDADPHGDIVVYERLPDWEPPFTPDTAKLARARKRLQDAGNLLLRDLL